MRIDVLSKEYPPEIYGGAGVHVAELVRALRVAARRRRAGALLRCAARRARHARRTPSPAVARRRPTRRIRTLGVDLAMVDDCAGADLVHSHTWYANMAGHLAGLLHGVPHVVSAHCLEPMRPWKAEQLGGGYAVSSWVERTAYDGAAGHHRGQRGDARRRAAQLSRRRPGAGARGPQRHRHRRLVARPDPDRVRELGVDPDRPSVIFVGRITRQKGLPLFLRAAAAAAARRAAGAVRRRARHPRDRGRGARPGRRPRRRRAPASCGSPRCCPAPTWSRC